MHSRERKKNELIQKLKDTISSLKRHIRFLEKELERSNKGGIVDKYSKEDTETNEEDFRKDFVKRFKP